MKDFYIKWIQIAIISNLIFLFIIAASFVEFLWEEILHGTIFIFIGLLGIIITNAYIILKKRNNEEFSIKIYFLLALIIPILLFFFIALMLASLWQLFYILFGGWTIV